MGSLARPGYSATMDGMCTYTYVPLFLLPLLAIHTTDNCCITFRYNSCDADVPLSSQRVLPSDYTVRISSFTLSFLSSLIFIFVHACFNALNNIVSYINTPPPPSSSNTLAAQCWVGSHHTFSKQRRTKSIQQARSHHTACRSHCSCTIIHVV